MMEKTYRDYIKKTVDLSHPGYVTIEFWFFGEKIFIVEFREPDNNDKKEYEFLGKSVPKWIANFVSYGNAYPHAESLIGDSDLYEWALDIVNDL